MPLDVNRLRDSQLSISASGDEFRAAVLLWCASWNQVPAASLPDDEKSLAAYAGYARDVKGWRKVRDGAMRGFVMCADGRWYHPVVAEKAIEAWSERQEYREGKENEKARKDREREWRKQAFEALRSINVVPEWNVKTSVLRAMISEHGLTSHIDAHVTCHAPVTVTGHAPVTAKTGTGTGTGKEEDQEKPGPNKSDPPSGGKKSKGSVTIDTWLATLDGADAIPPTDTVFAYAESAGIPPEFLELSWRVFLRKARASGKRQKDWRQTYRNYVEGNYLKLWWFDPDGECRLTTVGEQEKRAMAA
ncbi:YdaU family protein [Luteibacter aegosomaticola]|uniref:DUF1376 domain-containing protein n=1 Tax=Luteibacter aegosomaticola TaxID=2911538 RepID=UPI001FFAB3AE|nr:DUF1376 domain-containing protein [Luteibacter aegosomaticola]UPG89296.1 YdaU family protein [Luteibacter aegosomaticola]